MNTDIQKKIKTLEKKMGKEKEELAELRKKLTPVKVDEYMFKNFEGVDVSLKDLFGDKKELILIHNMGSGCAWCTMWADGFTGIVDYIESKAAFVVTSPDDFQVQRKFHQMKCWNFRMYSTKGTTFRKDMGFESENGPQPGVSSFIKKDGEVYLISSAEIGPHDNFCVTYDLLDLLPSGWKDWDEKNVPAIAFRTSESDCHCGGSCDGNCEGGCGGEGCSCSDEGCEGNSGACSCC
jgi:predicted dithiol-disulfide oxidoreductase (DUF899 family)